MSALPKPARRLPFWFDTVPDEAKAALARGELEERDCMILAEMLRGSREGYRYAPGAKFTKKAFHERYKERRGWSERNIQRSFGRLKVHGFMAHEGDENDITGGRIVFPFLMTNLRIVSEGGPSLSPPPRGAKFGPRGETTLAPPGSQVCLPPPLLDAPARPESKTSEKTTTTEPRESLSFSPRTLPKPPIAAEPESPTVAPPDGFDPTAVKPFADRMAALRLVTSSAEVFGREIIALGQEFKRPPAEFLGWVGLTVEVAEDREEGKEPVRNWKWFEGTLRKWHRLGGPSLPGARKPKAAPPAQAVVHRRPAEDLGPKTPDRMTDQELADERTGLAEHKARCESHAKTARNPDARARFERDAGSAGARLDELDREMARRDVILISQHHHIIH